MTDSASQTRIDQALQEIEKEFGPQITLLLGRLNETRLDRTGKLTARPARDRNGLRWTLAWRQPNGISFELSVVIQVEDDGQVARPVRVWVHRHAMTDATFEGHTPTTKMRRLSGLSMDAIERAVLAEWP
jgi:hypothetical protein